MSKQKDELGDLSKQYNPRSAEGELPNPNERFVTEDDNEIDDNPDFDNENNEVDDDLNNNEEQYVPQELIQEMLSLPDEELLKYGIDDPKQWKSYQRAFTKANQELKALRSGKSLQNGESDEISELKRQIAELKNPKQQSKPLEKPVRPALPKMPANFDYSRTTEQGTAEYAYMQDKLNYDQQLAEYQIKYEQYKEAQDEIHRSQLKNQSEATQKAIENQQLKANMIARLAKKDLTPAEASAAFEMALKPDFYDDELIALGYKLKMGKKISALKKPENTGKKFDKRSKFFSLGQGGGNNNSYKPRDGEFSSSKDTSNFYKPLNSK